jgi:DNA repair protein RadC
MEKSTFYTIAESHLVLDNADRRYLLKVRDLPHEQKPREKMLLHGPGALTTQELLAAILNTGSIKEEVLAMSTRIMNEYGEQSVMHARNPTKLAADAAIPLGKAIQIVAVAELGRRFFQKNAAAAPTIRTAAEVFEYVQDMRELSKEHLRGIYLNAHYKVIHDETISIGTVDANIIHPREVFKPALEYSAAAVILVHNHPSGSVEPSGSDREVTEQLIAAGGLLGIDLIDHVIVTKESYASIPARYQQL